MHENGVVQDQPLLISAKEAAKRLGVSPNVIYKLWKNSQLDFWCIHGTKKTTVKALEEFLERTRNQENVVR